MKKIIILVLLIIVLVVLLMKAIKRIWILKKKLKDSIMVNEFTNDVVKPEYRRLSIYLQKKRKINLEAKIDILNMWNRILLLLPIDYSKQVEVRFNELKVEKNTMSVLDHKWSAIEALEALYQVDVLEPRYLQVLTYHIYYLIIL